MKVKKKIIGDKYVTNLDKTPCNDCKHQLTTVISGSVGCLEFTEAKFLELERKRKCKRIKYSTFITLSLLQYTIYNLTS